MIELKQHPDYFKLDAEQKDFIQRLLFFDYLEEAEVANFKGKPRIILAQKFKEDLKYHIEQQNYETCQLYIDTIKRFKKEIIHFDS